MQFADWQTDLVLLGLQLAAVIVQMNLCSSIGLFCESLQLPPNSPSAILKICFKTHSARIAIQRDQAHDGCLPCGELCLFCVQRQASRENTNYYYNNNYIEYLREKNK